MTWDPWDRPTSDAYIGSDGLTTGRVPLVTAQGAIVSGGALLGRGTVLGNVTGTSTYKPCVASAADGSEIPAAILADDIDVTGGDKGGAIYLAGEFLADKLIVDPSWTIADLTTRLRLFGIFIISSAAQSAFA